MVEYVLLFFTVLLVKNKNDVCNHLFTTCSNLLFFCSRQFEVTLSLTLIIRNLRNVEKQQKAT